MHIPLGPNCAKVPCARARMDQLGRFREALSLLALELRDTTSAEALCSQNGSVLSPMVADAVAQEHNLKPFATLVSRGKQKEESKEKEQKNRLLKILLEVYMESGDQCVFLYFCASLHRWA